MTTSYKLTLFTNMKYEPVRPQLLQSGKSLSSMELQQQLLQLWTILSSLSAYCDVPVLSESQGATLHRLSQ